MLFITLWAHGGITGRYPLLDATHGGAGPRLKIVSVNLIAS